MPDSGEIYAATVSDFVGNDPLIYRRKLNEGERTGLRTQRDDARVLDAPNFVATFVYKEHVYFWYRERASEAVDNNEERQVYARVARVCSNDRGGPRPASERWTSFLKARLNCSLASPTPFYFNELKAVSDPIPSTNGDHIVYALFSTPDSPVQMSAVCTFSMKRIREEFDHGTFKRQRNTDSLWEAFPRSEMPKPRPGTCVPDSVRLPEATISFVLANPLMHKCINSVNGPLLIEGVDRAQLTQIAVLPQIQSVNGQKFDVIYLGTVDGNVLKVVNTGDNVTVVQMTKIFAHPQPVVNLLTKSQQLVVVSSNEIAAIGVQQCEQQTSCSRCVQLQDPHCAWDVNSGRCVSESSWSGGHFIQNLAMGQSEQCPDGIAIDDPYYIDMPSGRVERQGSAYSAQSLLLGCVLCITITGLAAFLVGYRVAICRRGLSDVPHSAASSSGSDYSFGRARLTRHDSLTACAKLDPYAGVPQQKQSVDATSLVLSMSHHISQAPSSHQAMSQSQHASGFTTPRDRNAILTSLHQSTLPRDYKVKKVYL
ncbi:hypothetical protein WR25_12440 isoform D [Diploscapter pachys]|nr:hypothetical protein WR25_12440 isoform D [Diploscapter pachys]